MANKKTSKAKKKNNKNLIIGICAAVAVVVAAIIAIVVVNLNSGISESYFVSDDTKYVLTLDAGQLSFEDEEQEINPVKAHFVYNYSGDEITGLTAYYEFADAETAKKALDLYNKELKEAEESEKSEGDDMVGYKDASVKGKYLVLTANESQYKDITVSDVKQQIEFMEMLKQMNEQDNSNNEESKDTEEAGDAEESGETENSDDQNGE